jgi:hypothetical protein
MAVITTTIKLKGLQADATIRRFPERKSGIMRNF